MKRIMINGKEYKFVQEKRIYHEVTLMCKTEKGFLLKHDGLPSIMDATRFIEYNLDGSTVNNNDVWFSMELVEDEHTDNIVIATILIVNNVPRAMNLEANFEIKKSETAKYVADFIKEEDNEE